jgi:hypothetical protein
MAEFSLHIRLDADECDPGGAESLLEPYAEADDAVTLGSADVDASSNPDVIVPEETLEIDDVDALAEIYTDLQDRQEVYDVSLWGPASERFPVPVEHYALQQLPDPDRYEFYALDGQVTLVICDSRMDLEQVRREVPAAALG